MSMQRLCRLHDELLQSVAAARDQLAGLKLTTFFPMRDSAATQSELMVVGRAVYGWQETPPWTAEDAREADCRERIIQEVFSRSTKWPEEFVNGEYGRRSAFWRVIRSVTQSIIPDAGEDWARRVIWSNLYKVAPSKRGNPSSPLRKAQLEANQHHLAEEFSLWKPKRILFLTRWDWLEPFLPHIGNPVGERRNGDVQWFGRLELPDGNKPRTVVCVHPQGRKKNPFVEGIISCFA